MSSFSLRRNPRNFFLDCQSQRLYGCRAAYVKCSIDVLRVCLRSVCDNFVLRNRAKKTQQQQQQQKKRTANVKQALLVNHVDSVRKLDSCMIP